MAALALEFLILTATRSGETLGAQWDEFDLDAAVWSIPKERMKKTDEAFSVPLSDRAVAILAEARRMARKEPTADGFVFFGVIPKRPLSNMALAMLLRRTNVDATAHGLRTSAGTWMADDVVARAVRGRGACLSHADRQRGEPSLCPFGHAGAPQTDHASLGGFPVRADRR